MRVGVTGGTGFVGSHATRALRTAGHDVRLLVRSEAKMARVFGPDAEGGATPIESFVLGDVTEPESVKRFLEGCDAVVHAAASVSIEGSRAAEVLATNARGAELVLRGAAEGGARSIVHLSSLTAILDPEAPTLDADSPIVSADSAYGRSKGEAEATARSLREAGAPVTILYPSAVVGPDDPGLAESMRGLAAIVQLGVFRTSGGWLAVDVRDLADATRRVVEAARPGGFIAAGHFFGWDALADVLGELAGRRIRRVPVNPRLLRAIGSLGDLVKRVVPFDYPLTRESMEMVTQMRDVASSPELAALGTRFRDPRETYRDALRALHAGGHLGDAQVPRIAAERGDRAR